MQCQCDVVTSFPHSVRHAILLCVVVGVWRCVWWCGVVWCGVVGWCGARSLLPLGSPKFHFPNHSANQVTKKSSDSANNCKCANVTEWLTDWMTEWRSKICKTENRKQRERKIGRSVDLWSGSNFGILELIINQFSTVHSILDLIL